MKKSEVDVLKDQLHDVRANLLTELAKATRALRRADSRVDRTICQRVRAPLMRLVKRLHSKARSLGYDFGGTLVRKEGSDRSVLEMASISRSWGGKVTHFDFLPEEKEMWVRLQDGPGKPPHVVMKMDIRDFEQVVEVWNEAWEDL